MVTPRLLASVDMAPHRTPTPDEGREGCRGPAAPVAAEPHTLPVDRGMGAVTARARAPSLSTHAAVSQDP
jgi:hypothetical protein